MKKNVWLRVTAGSVFGANTLQHDRFKIPSRFTSGIWMGTLFYI